MRIGFTVAIAITGLFILACGGGDDAPAPAPTKSLEGKGTKAKPVRADCWTTGRNLERNPGETAWVTCPANCTTGLIWGGPRYTPDSKICVAAVHAGAINARNGGPVQVDIKGQAGPFSGYPANGITSQSWSSTYDMTFMISGGKDGKAKAGKGGKGDKAGKAGKGGKGGKGGKAKK